MNAHLYRTWKKKVNGGSETSNIRTGLFSQKIAPSILRFLAHPFQRPQNIAVAPVATTTLAMTSISQGACAKLLE